MAYELRMAYIFLSYWKKKNKQTKKKTNVFVTLEYYMKFNVHCP